MQVRFGTHMAILFSKHFRGITMLTSTTDVDAEELFTVLHFFTYIQSDIEASNALFENPKPD
jgi:hypothetical protein